MKKIESHIIISIVVIAIFIFSSCNQKNQDDMSEVLIEFFDSLEEDNTQSGVLIDLEDSGFWNDFLSFGNKMKDEKISLVPPNVKPILESPLILHGDTIREVVVNARKKTIGEAYCVNGKPTIKYYTKMKYMDEYAIAFFRMHEYAHFLLGHAECGKNVFPKPELEFAADKKAIELLEQFSDGDRIVDHARGIMLGMNRRRTSTHPSSVERARAFYE